MRCLIMLVFLMTVLNASDEGTAYDRAMAQYRSGDTAQAFAAFHALAEAGDADAARALGGMYDTGEGTPVDKAKARYWYKKAADLYAAQTRDTEKASDSRRGTLYGGYDPIEDDPDAQESIYRHAEQVAGFNAYKRNYFMPYSVADNVYPSYVPSDRYRDVEAEFQLSISIDGAQNLAGLGEIYGFGVTEHVFWQVYTPSAPFREMDFNPELFVLFPLKRRVGTLHLETLKVTLSHQSNGQGDIQALDINQSEYPDASPYWFKNRSRSWDYVSAVLGVQYERLFADLTLWVRLDRTGENDDPELIDYLGHGQLDLRYYTGKNQFDLMMRLNPQTGRGAVEAGWSYPVYGRDALYWYVKGFSGYGESLIDYNRNVNKFSVGFSFFR
jgi:phospholipase A1/A2